MSKHLSQKKSVCYSSGRRIIHCRPIGKNDVSLLTFANARQTNSFRYLNLFFFFTGRASAQNVNPLQTHNEHKQALSHERYADLLVTVPRKTL